jgi:hypothetical protein
VKEASRHIFSVHATKPDELGAVEVVFTTERDARRYARDRSMDSHVTSASVTRFTVDELGTRHPVAWYRDGKEQPMRFHDRQLYPCAASSSPSCRRCGGDPRAAHRLGPRSHRDPGPAVRAAARRRTHLNVRSRKRQRPRSPRAGALFVVQVVG